MNHIVEYFTFNTQLEPNFPGSFVHYSVSLLELAKIEEERGSASKAKKYREKAIEIYQISKTKKDQFPLYSMFSQMLMIDLTPYMDILEPTAKSSKKKRSSRKI